MERLHLLLEELAVHEGREGIRVLVIDDAPEPRPLAGLWPDQRVLRTPLWASGQAPDVLSAHVAGTLIGLSTASDVEFVVKLDTDAAVIAPFAAALRSVFDDLAIGVVGSYDRAYGGGLRDWSRWKHAIDRAAMPIRVRRAARGIRVRLVPPAHVRRIRAARAAAYRVAPPGAHCLGGAYAVSSAFLGKARLEWEPWVETGLGEDVVIGLIALEAGLRMASLTREGEPFALTWRGLPGPVAELRAAGYSIVHSVKRPTMEEERQLRSELQR